MSYCTNDDVATEYQEEHLTCEFASRTYFYIVQHNHLHERYIELVTKLSRLEK